MKSTRTSVYPVEVQGDFYEPTIKILGVGKRKIALSSLRPGDWLELWLPSSFVSYRYLVRINSFKLRRINLWADGQLFTLPYSEFTDSYAYLGKGKLRWWWAFLPKFLRQHLAPCSSPR